MTKFEEEFKALTSWDWVNVDLIQQILTRFGNWHSDEEFQAKEKEIKRLRKINHLYKKAKGNAERLAVDRGERLNQAQDELASLESQLQQQALPVVPDFIGKLINTFGAPEDGKYINYSASYLENQKELDWIDNHQKTWLTALLIGFTVEKPQLFYLKHIDMSKRNSINDLYLKKYIHAALTGTGEHRIAHAMSAKGTYPSKDYCAFTQQEIDSMQTGSYEQIEVAE
ncbi:DUF1642 domain-containing protein [Lactococcus lactis]|uniref:DUF1642 domain-containing protein n=1 Tax=Lactococcus lactis TaxID=1358 RepID=UPI0025A2C13F|nr:DUF1642 domain-containing protein [Lactococcus lactis]MDM7545179.1 DUF1642 domain-containing protein [Lactococcus lactis]